MIMKKKFSNFLVVTVIAGIVLSLVGVALVSQAKSEPARKIVVFKAGVDEATREILINKVGGVKIKDLKLVEGKAVLLSPQAEKTLARQAGVLRIDDDVVVEALIRSGIAAKPAPAQPAEILPWGVDRIDADLVWGTTTGDSIKVAIIDTGIDLKHPDLKDNIKGGYNAINPRKSANDDNGHGTHVAGIVGAIDNTIGVIGVGPQIDLYAVKVLDRNGSGYLSDVIEGLDWAITNRMQVVNMSLGTSSDIQSLHDVVARANAAGIVQVAAAGNSGGSVIYPAAYLEVIAVSATDKTDTIASWSSRGPEVDLAAPGVNIYSTYNGQTYKTLSGTSMAAPHVAGAAALVLSVSGKCEFLLDDVSGCSPSEVQQRLETTAEDLGVVGRDDLYGSGLVDAKKAVLAP
ncbi:MAG: peptidase S8 [Candidatus Nealsonbacteria bacterium CG08_land_8_20_14_0_20_38_20]|uniref:Peptidase S8 n=1 Tax=Candidatus Nealsonbacteria bacterium CG08_land_8_20_14_0_20_38_20 TaxID=1974705 RepID=A0A2H0YLX4_9BACT|nr:MAG: peptidase S8 [Candidatus Nealsonbacteria bacterium CG08_land_8_20_14_0_20_38_20]